MAQNTEHCPIHDLVKKRQSYKYHFSSTCTELISNSISPWTFARITSIPSPKPQDVERTDDTGTKHYNHFFGFAEEISPCNTKKHKTSRNIWFKLATHVQDGVMVGPIKFGDSNYTTLPSPGDIIVGHVVPNIHRTGYRYEWWCRDAQPILNLTRACSGCTMTPQELCDNLRIMSDLNNDQVWALARLILHEDLQSFVDQYKPPHQRYPHPIRLNGPKGYILSPLTTARFIFEVSKVCRCPMIFTHFTSLMQEQRDQLLEYPEEELQELQVHHQSFTQDITSDTCYDEM